MSAPFDHIYVTGVEGAPSAICERDHVWHERSSDEATLSFSNKIFRDQVNWHRVRCCHRQIESKALLVPCTESLLAQARAHRHGSRNVKHLDLHRVPGQQAHSEHGRRRLQEESAGRALLTCATITVTPTSLRIHSTPLLTGGKRTDLARRRHEPRIVEALPAIRRDGVSS